MEQVQRLEKSRAAVGRAYREKIKEAFEGILDAYITMCHSMTSSLPPQADEDDDDSLGSAAAMDGPAQDPPELRPHANAAKNQLAVQFSAENIVRYTEELSFLAMEMQRKLVMHSHEELEAYNAERIDALTRFHSLTHDTMSSMKTDLSAHLYRMENALYSSALPETIPEL